MRSDIDPEKDGADTVDGPPKEQRPLAVETLGLGDLSLSHLGIAVDPALDRGGSPMVPNGAAPDGESRREGVKAARSRNSTNASQATVSKLELAPESWKADSSLGPGEAGKRGVRGNGSGGDAGSVPVVQDVVPGTRPRSGHESITGGPQASANAVEGDHEIGFKRSGSVRSRVDSTLRRKRGGSSATGTTVATVPGTNAAAMTPTSPGVVPRLTGFAVASKKRNRDFHQLFRSVPEDDYLIEDYSAAIQKDILLHGRLYVSESHLCFYSNIFGYVTTLVISFDEVVSVEKKTTAMLFPNAIVIQTLHARNTFASLASRESTYDLIVGIWKIGHPNLRSSLNGVQLDEAGGGGDKTVKAERSSSEGHSEHDEDDEEAVYDEDVEEEEGLGSFTEAGDGSLAGSEAGEVVSRANARKASAGLGMARGPTNEQPANGDTRLEKGSIAGPSSAADFPGPATHRPTECSDQHFERLIRDDTLPAPLGKIYDLLFGPASGAFMTNWLLEEQKVLDLQLEDDKIGLTETKRTRVHSYIKPLSAPIGPKQTKCIITETLESIDLEKAVSVLVTTQTPDVPSGGAFVTRTKYCLTWAEGNATRVFINCTIEWSGKSWLKGSSSGLMLGAVTITPLTCSPPRSDRERRQ